MEETLGKRIMQNRKRLNLTQDQLAERLGVTAQAVSKWENDQSCPDISMLPRLAEIFGISIDALLGAKRPAQEAQIVDDDTPPDAVTANNGKWSFQWNGGRRSEMGFALWVLLLGGLLLASNLLHWEVGFWSLAWPSFLIVFGLFGGRGFSFFRLGCVLFGGYFLLDNIGLLPFALGGNLLWPLLVILFGLGLLADSLRKPKKPVFVSGNGNRPHARHENVSICDIQEDSFRCESCFGENTYSVNSLCLRNGSIENAFGSAVVDLTAVNELAEDCVVNVECAFGQVDLLVPRRFYVTADPSCCFGTVETVGDPDNVPQGKLSLRCEASFGRVRIIYS